MKPFKRFDLLFKQTIPVPQARGLASAVAPKMDITTRYKMSSGYDIPILGYGVRFIIFPSTVLPVISLHEALRQRDLFVMRD